MPDFSLPVVKRGHRVPGQVFDVELTITQSGSAFNGYDAVVGFDPDALTFIQLSEAEQAGPLMTDACANIFHVFQVSPSGDTLNISHILLCSGVDVTGPGVVYRLRFQARDVDETTAISLLSGTAFYNGGLYVTPVFTHAAEVQIGDVSPVVDIPAVSTPDFSAAPNPFNPSTTLSFVAGETAEARITIYSPRGSLVATLLEGQVFAGPNSVAWDGRNDLGTMMGSGVYLVRLELG